jgi:ATP synthase protein I
LLTATRKFDVMAALGPRESTTPTSRIDAHRGDERDVPVGPDTRAGLESEDRWNDDWDDEPVRPLTRPEALALMKREPSVSPWAVVAMQFVVGLVVAALAWGLTQRMAGFWSALYGAATAVVPGALLARGMTSRLSSLSPAVSAVSVMLWETVKIGTSVALLALAPKVVTPLDWPVLLAALGVCLSVYWFALLWRGRGSRG